MKCSYVSCLYHDYVTNELLLFEINVTQIGYQDEGIGIWRMCMKYCAE